MIIFRCDRLFCRAEMDLMNIVNRLCLREQLNVATGERRGTGLAS